MSRTDSRKNNEWFASEPFAEFQAACEINDAKSALNSLTVWLGYFRQELGLTVQQFSQVLGKKQFAEQLAIVRLAIEDPEADWSGEELYVSVVDVLSKIHANFRSSS